MVTGHGTGSTSFDPYWVRVSVVVPVTTSSSGPEKTYPVFKRPGTASVFPLKNVSVCFSSL